MDRNRFRGTLGVFSCVLMWSLIPVVSKLGQENMDHHQFLFWSSAVSSVVLNAPLAMVGRLRSLRELTIPGVIRLGLLGLLGTYLYYLLLYYGYAKADGMEVLVVQYSWPFFVILLTTPVLKERLSGKRVVAVLLGFLGAMLVDSKGRLLSFSVSNGGAVLLVPAGAVCFALFSVLSRTVPVDPLVATTIYFLFATFASAISVSLFSRWRWPTDAEILPVLLNGTLIDGFS